MADTKTAKSEEVEEKANAVESEAQVDTSKIDAEVLQNIPVTVSVEVGRTSLKIRDLMRLAQGSVVELDRLAGESLDLMVNNTPVAQVEIVLVNERYGIKLTSVKELPSKCTSFKVLIFFDLIFASSSALIEIISFLFLLRCSVLAITSWPLKQPFEKET